LPPRSTVPLATRSSAVPPHQAVVILKNSHIVAERYAEGYGIDTPILGFSATKSVISALTGILVRQGALTLDRPAPVAAWQGAGDPRHAITVDHLLRHTAGLALGSSLSASLGSALEPVNRMKIYRTGYGRLCESIELETPPAGRGITTMQYHHSLASAPQRDRRPRI